MATPITGFREIIETTVRSAFEKQMEEALNKVFQECDRKIDEAKAKARGDAQLMAKRLAVELLHKADIRGMSFELKL